MWKVGNRRRGDRGEYVGRPSPLGNPFAMRDESQRDGVVDAYAQWLQERMQENGPQRAEIERLAASLDGTLVCWCAPLRCHADVISEWIERVRDGRK
ncbi:MAG: DUF4326 domain-containing protein [Acidobacteria bacterium]|nr:DUF4326 domain-containing protein [Acidobacteriota bacterium]